MPIITTDRFNYFKPNRSVADYQGGEVGQPSSVLPSSRAMGNLGAVTRQAIKYTQDFGKRLQAQIDDSEMGKAIAEFHLRRTQREIEAENLGDYTQGPEYVQGHLREDISGIGDNFITNPRTREKFALYANDLAGQSYSRVAWRTQNRHIDEMAAQYHNDMQKNLEALNRRPQDWPIIEQEILRATDKMAQSGFLTFERAQEYKEFYQALIDEMRIKHLMLNAYEGYIQPDKVLDELKNPDNYTRINPVRRQELIKQFHGTIKQLNVISKQLEREQKLREKAEKEAKEESISQDFLEKIYTNPFKVDPRDILASDLPATKQEKYLDMREKRIDEILTGKKNPYNISDPSFESETLTRAMNGEIDPKDIQVIPGKLSVQAMKIAKQEAQQAKEATGDTTAQQYQELKKLAISDGREQIEIKSEFLGKDADSVARANIFEQNLLKALYAESDINKRMKMLTRDDPDFIVDKLIVPHVLPLSKQLEILQMRFDPQKAFKKVEELEAGRQLTLKNMPVTDENIKAAIALMRAGAPVTPGNISNAIIQMRKLEKEEE